MSADQFDNHGRTGPWVLIQLLDHQPQKRRKPSINDARCREIRRQPAAVFAASAAFAACVFAAIVASVAGVAAPLAALSLEGHSVSLTADVVCLVSAGGSAVPGFAS